MERARSAGYTALCLTVDVPVVGLRERDVRNGLTIPPRLRPRSLGGVVRRPGWALQFVREHLFGSPLTFANFTMAPTQSKGASALGAFVNTQFDSSVTWADLAWLKQMWDGPLVVKGVMRADDARRCVDSGADAVVVSNHGGRQFDGALATIDALPGVVDAVGSDAEVFIDGGIRRGTDVLRALALGATACLIGRPYVYGLAAGGSDGVMRVIEIFQSEIDRALALLGCADIHDVDRALLTRSAS